MTHPINLVAAARLEMLRNGFEPDFPPAVLQQVHAMADDHGVPAGDAAVRDLRTLPWSSIDNPESRDLDQVEVVDAKPDGSVHVMVGVADVDSRVATGTPADQHAGHNTTSVYCGVVTFPMLPERLSTDLTSLNEGVDRVAVVIDYTVMPDGSVTGRDVYRALVHNTAQLDYPSVGDWLAGTGPMPAKVAASSVLQQQLKLQDEAAGWLRQQRHVAGALEFQSIETTPVMKDGQATDLMIRPTNRATQLIEDFMIAANTTMALFLEQHRSSSIHRVVRVPARWDRIVTLAATFGEHLPAEPDSGSLAAFLARRRTADPDHFPDLSLAIVKLMGPGIYVLQRPGQEGDGHFGLAVHDYSHSTAPNRRYPDLIVQRLLKSVLAGAPPAYDDAALDAIAAQCTTMEAATRKVERTCRKQAAAQVLAPRVGQTFAGIVTGASPKGTFVRTLRPPAEGMVVQGQHGMDVGDKVNVRLLATDARRGFIDFARA